MRYREAMGNAVDVLTFLGFAALVGLTVGTCLGLLALALASPAHAGETPAGNLLLHRASSEGAAPAPVVSTETTFRSDGPILRVHVVQAFRNPFRDPQEGLYVIQLPPQATLERILVRVRPSADDEGDGAHELEPEAIPALLSGAEDAGVVSRAITGIDPGETVVVELEYQQVTRYDRGRLAQRFLTQWPTRGAAAGRRRRALPAEAGRRVPLGVEAAWRSDPPSVQHGMPWLWLLPVVALYVAVAFFS